MKITITIQIYYYRAHTCITMTRSQILVSFQCQTCKKIIDTTIFVVHTWIIASMKAYIQGFQKMYKWMNEWKNELVDNLLKMSHLEENCIFWHVFLLFYLQTVALNYEIQGFIKIEPSVRVWFSRGTSKFDVDDGKVIYLTREQT